MWDDDEEDLGGRFDDDDDLSECQANELMDAGFCTNFSTKHDRKVFEEAIKRVPVAVIKEEVYREVGKPLKINGEASLWWHFPEDTKFTSGNFWDEVRSIEAEMAATDSPT